MKFIGLSVIFCGLFVLYAAAVVGVDTGIRGVPNVASIPGVIIGVGLLIVGAIFAAAGEVVGSKESEKNKRTNSETQNTSHPKKDKLPETFESQSREVRISKDGSVIYRGETAKKVGKLYHYRGKTFLAKDRLIQEIDSMF